MPHRLRPMIDEGDPSVRSNRWLGGVQPPVWLQLLIDVGGEADGPALGYRRVHELADG
jgi:hypothetical protein